MNCADQSGAVPFLDIANHYILAGAQCDPQILAGLSVAQIASQLRDPSSPVARASTDRPGSSSQPSTKSCTALPPGARGTDDCRSLSFRMVLDQGHAVHGYAPGLKGADPRPGDRLSPSHVAAPDRLESSRQPCAVAREELPQPGGVCLQKALPADIAAKGSRVGWWRSQMLDGYADLPTAFTRLVTDIDRWLQERPDLPEIIRPQLPAGALRPSPDPAGIRKPPGPVPRLRRKDPGLVRRRGTPREYCTVAKVFEDDFAPRPYLHESVRTGSVCRYEPNREAPVRWVLGDAGLFERHQP